MIRFLISIIFILAIVIKSNAQELEIIELHNKKTLDELVVEKINENNNKSDEDNETIKNKNNIEKVIEVTNENENDSEVIIEDSKDNNLSFLKSLEISNLEKYLNNSQKIKSKVLYDEYINFLVNINFDLSLKKHADVFYIIVKKLYETGEITNAYSLIKGRDLTNNSNYSFYKMIEYNFLLSTHQLSQVCNLKNENLENIKIKNNFLIKIDIFCLLLEEKFLEADLQFSLLNEIEENIDKNFNNLYFSLIDNYDSSNELIDFKNLNKDLVFLYSSMMKIGEIPINEDFYKIDQNNLAISLILNNKADIETRLKAANISYLSNKISIDSLSALYQSVDFNSNQLSNPKQTIEELGEKKEMIIAFYYQLSNIQIFPSQRLNVLIDFWLFAESNDLERIAYPLSQNIINSIEPSSENSPNSLELAKANIQNGDYDTAERWIQFYEDTVGIDENSIYIRFLNDLKQAEDLSPIIKFISVNMNDADFTIPKNKEIFYVLLNIFENNELNNFEEDFVSVFDDREMPTIFFNLLLKKSIDTKNHFEFLFLTLSSINNKNWKELHPMHLQLLLLGFKSYENSEILNKLIIEILENYKIL